MNMINIRDYLFKDRPGEELGLRSEAVIAQGLGLLVTVLAIPAFHNQIVIYTSIVTNLVAIFTLVQAIRGKFNYLILFPIVTAFSICITSIVEGKGSNDLLWVGTIGLFLLANIYSRRNAFPAVILGVFMIVLFLGTGIAEMSNIIPNQYGTDLEHILLGSLYLSAIMAALMAVFHRNRSLINAAVLSAEEKQAVSQKLESTNLVLDEQVRARTNELHQSNNQLMVKAARLQAASDISQDLMRIFNENPNEILNHAARIISEKLGFYHVGIFLVDTARGFAVLQAANSKGGQQMLAKRHQLKIGGTGIVGYVSQSGRSRIALDTGVDAVYFNNPYLPETRSELSLPIKFGNVVIGVLDVQSTQSAAFSEEDTSTLMTIANQLAVLLHKNDESTSSASKGGKRGSYFATLEKQLGYSFRSDGSIVSNVKLETNSLVEKAITSGEVAALNRSSKDGMPMLAVPVKFRDQVIGIIQIEAAETNRNWTEDEIMLVQAISDRAALALENARLFENATHRAEQEETISRVTAQIGASTDFDRIMQTTIQELGLALGASRSFIQIGTPSISDEKVKP